MSEVPTESIPVPLDVLPNREKGPKHQRRVKSWQRRVLEKLRSRPLGLPTVATSILLTTAILEGMHQSSARKDTPSLALDGAPPSASATPFPETKPTIDYGVRRESPLSIEDREASEKEAQALISAITAPLFLDPEDPSMRNSDSARIRQNLDLSEQPGSVQEGLIHRGTMTRDNTQYEISASELDGRLTSLSFGWELSKPSETLNEGEIIDYSKWKITIDPDGHMVMLRSTPREGQIKYSTEELLNEGQRPLMTYDIQSALVGQGSILNAIQEGPR